MCSSLRVYDCIKWVWLNSSPEPGSAAGEYYVRVLFLSSRVCVCVSEMCVEDLQSWGWTDLCVPPPDLLDCMWMLVFFLPLFFFMI